MNTESHIAPTIVIFFFLTIALMVTSLSLGGALPRTDKYKCSPCSPTEIREEELQLANNLCSARPLWTPETCQYWDQVQIVLLVLSCTSVIFMPIGVLVAYIIYKYRAHNIRRCHHTVSPAENQQEMSAQSSSSSSQDA